MAELFDLGDGWQTVSLTAATRANADAARQHRIQGCGARHATGPKLSTSARTMPGMNDVLARVVPPSPMVGLVLGFLAARLLESTLVGGSHC